MKYLTKIRKDVYHTKEANVSLELEAMGIERIGLEYKKNEPNKTIGWYYLIQESVINDITAELKRRLG